MKTAEGSELAPKLFLISGGQMPGEHPAGDRLGGTPEGRVQRYFCVDEENCRAFERISKDARVLRKEPKEILMSGKHVQGWIVELLVPATDGVVRIDPMSKP